MSLSGGGGGAFERVTGGEWRVCKAARDMHGGGDDPSLRTLDSKTLKSVRSSLRLRLPVPHGAACRMNCVHVSLCDASSKFCALSQTLSLGGSERRKYRPRLFHRLRYTRWKRSISMTPSLNACASLRGSPRRRRDDTAPLWSRRRRPSAREEVGAAAS